jgi:hypothetical protein
LRKVTFDRIRDADGEKRLLPGHTPALVAAAVLGEPVIRSGMPKNLIAKVYFGSTDGERNMVRFYRPAENAARR